MGFITTKNRITGKEVYACEAELEGCLDYPCKAHHCPHGWCQRYYLCDNCWNKLKATWSELSHKREEEERELINSGKLLRVAALSHGEKVKVIFRGNKTEKAFWMNPETYHSIPLMQPATIEDFQLKGILTECQSTDIYNPV